MLGTVALVLLVANPPDLTTLPRHPDPDPIENRDQREGTPTDPWFDRKFVATDDAAFILTAVESTRQARVESLKAEDTVQRPQLRQAARRIRAQDEATTRSLEKIARQKGWRLPQDNPHRDSTIARKNPKLIDANYLLNEIAYHQNTIAQYRAQAEGKGDPDLKRALKAALPGYQRNLEMLLAIEY